MKLTVSKEGVFLDGVKVPRCERVDLKNIGPMSDVDVTLHLSVDEVDIQYGYDGLTHIDEVRRTFFRGQPLMPE